MFMGLSLIFTNSSIKYEASVVMASSKSFFPKWRNDDMMNLRQGFTEDNLLTVFKMKNEKQVDNQPKIHVCSGHNVMRTSTYDMYEESEG